MLGPQARALHVSVNEPRPHFVSRSFPMKPFQPIREGQRTLLSAGRPTEILSFSVVVSFLLLFFLSTVSSASCAAPLPCTFPLFPFPASTLLPFLSFSCAQPSCSPFLSYSTVSDAPSVVRSLCLHHRFPLRVPPFLPQAPLEGSPGASKVQ